MRARYRCACGYEAEDAPSDPNREIVSIYHIHRGPDLRGGTVLVRMEPVTRAAPDVREPAVTAAR
jgi:hypothetical protein